MMMTLLVSSKIMAGQSIAVTSNAAGSPTAVMAHTRAYLYAHAERWLTPGTEYAVTEKLPLPREWYTDMETEAISSAAAGPLMSMESIPANMDVTDLAAGTSPTRLSAVPKAHSVRWLLRRPCLTIRTNFLCVPCASYICSDSWKAIDALVCTVTQLPAVRFMREAHNLSPIL